MPALRGNLRLLAGDGPAAEVMWRVDAQPQGDTSDRGVLLPGVASGTTDADGGFVAHLAHTPADSPAFYTLYAAGLWWRFQYAEATALANPTWTIRDYIEAYYVAHPDGAPTVTHVPTEGPPGARGPQGRFLVQIYRVATTGSITQAPVGGSYDLSTGVLAAPVNWSLNAGTPGANQSLYESTAAINPAAGDTGTITPTWSPPYVVESSVDSVARASAAAALAAAEERTLPTDFTSTSSITAAHNAGTGAVSHTLNRADLSRIAAEAGTLIGGYLRVTAALGVEAVAITDRLGTGFGTVVPTTTTVGTWYFRYEIESGTTGRLVSIWQANRPEIGAGKVWTKLLDVPEGGSDATILDSTQIKETVDSDGNVSLFFQGSNESLTLAQIIDAKISTLNNTLGALITANTNAIAALPPPIPARTDAAIRGVAGAMWSDEAQVSYNPATGKLDIDFPSGGNPTFTRTVLRTFDNGNKIGVWRVATYRAGNASVPSVKGWLKTDGSWSVSSSDILDVKDAVEVTDAWWGPGGSGGVTDYDDLTDKPIIRGTVASTPPTLANQGAILLDTHTHRRFWQRHADGHGATVGWRTVGSLDLRGYTSLLLNYMGAVDSEAELPAQVDLAAYWVRSTASFVYYTEADGNWQTLTVPHVVGNFASEAEADDAVVNAWQRSGPVGVSAVNYIAGWHDSTSPSYWEAVPHIVTTWSAPTATTREWVDVDAGIQRAIFAVGQRTDDIDTRVTNLQATVVVEQGEIDDLQDQVGNLSFKVITQADYDALSPPDPNTLYFISG